MAEAGSTQRGRGWRRVVPLNVRGDIVLGLVVVVLTLVGAAHVSPWLDEAATANIVSYPTWDMTQLWTASRWWFKGVDVALAPYYLVVHQWVRLVGISPLTLRLPSVIAAGVGTAVMAAVGRRLVGRRGNLPMRRVTVCCHARRLWPLRLGLMPSHQCSWLRRCSSL